MLSAWVADLSEDRPSALENISKAVSLFQKAGDKDLWRQALSFKANLQHRRGLYEDSIVTYQELLELAGGPQGDLIRATCLSEIALLNYKMGRDKDVVAFAQEALAIFRSNDAAKGEADCLKILGNQASGRGGSKDALDFYDRAAAKYREAGDVHGQANCLYNIGIALQSEHRYDEAIASLQEAVGAYTRSASVGGVGIANMELGHTYLLAGDIPKAMATLELAESLLRREQDLCRLAETEGYFVDLNMTQGDRRAAMARCNEAIRLYEQAGLEDRVARERKRLQAISSGPENTLQEKTR